MQATVRARGVPLTAVLKGYQTAAAQGALRYWAHGAQSIQGSGSPPRRANLHCTVRFAGCCGVPPCAGQDIRSRPGQRAYDGMGCNSSAGRAHHAS